MNPERWQQIDRLFHSALERDGRERSAFLAQACLGDEPLRDEVESLLTSHDQAASFIEKPAGDAAADLLAEHRARLEPGTMVNRYKILDLLGEGGMGEVYLAQDMRLGRKVALKLLPAYLRNDGDRLLRFEQEARAASTLSHANVCVVYEVGEAKGARHFMVMEYVEGMTLRERMADTRMKISEVLDTAIQIASALAAAHKAGIVHRDIKPENVMLGPDGYVKVLDFGLAKLTERPTFAEDPEAATGVHVKTNPGLVMGTVQYMSPEQARGQDLDARSDIWSLGVILYEMVTGRAPFQGETSSHVIVSIIENEPSPLTNYEEVPAELERIVGKALRKNKEERYQTASDLAQDLKSLKQEQEVEVRLKRSVELNETVGAASSKSDGQTVDTFHASAARTADVRATRPTSSVEYLVREIKSHRRGLVLAAAAVVIVVTTAAYFYIARGGKVAAISETIDSVAVLPFVNVSADADTEYLSDGISDSIINSLSQLPNLKVIALNSVLRYKGKQTDPQAVGRELGVRAVLMGRFNLRGDDLSISTELVDVRDNRRLWGQQYNRKLANVIAVQEDISREISEGLRLRSSAEEKKQLSKRYTENSEAYGAYLQGRFFFSQSGTEAGQKTAIEYFELAIKKDPAYAPAYVGLARVYWRSSNYSYLSPKDARQKGESLLQKALEIDDTLAEAHAMLAAFRQVEGDWPGAEKEFGRAMELNPRAWGVRGLYASYLVAIGRNDDAVAEAKRALEIDPLSPSAVGGVALVSLQARQYDQAIEFFRKAIAMQPTDPRFHNNLARALVQKAMYEEAITEFQKGIALDNSAPGRSAHLAYTFAMMGKRAEAQKMLDELKERAKQSNVAPINFAIIYTGLGEKDQAFAWLEKAFPIDRSGPPYVQIDPVLDSLRSDPRFGDLARRKGLAS